MKTRIAGLITVLLSAGASAFAQSDFNDFIAGVRAANAPEYRHDAAAFEEMRQHILTMYQGVAVSHSFTQNSYHVDCVPLMQQPSVRLLGLAGIAAPPSYSTPREVADATRLTPQQDAAAERCETGTIPMRRITLEDLARFATLHDYSQKSAGESVPRPRAAPAQAHKYSYTYQTVNAVGGSSNLNLWNPTVNTSKGEIFSLSQEWYVGGNGAKTQTAEVGWQNYPGFYGTTDSVLFIYWTADDYTRTGCYNLTCPGFVQTDNSWTLGGAFPNYSTLGGKQYEFSAEYSLQGGDWWLILNGTPVGYFPATIYRNGQLSRYAQLIEFGSESVGETVYPPEGSGEFASAGDKYAAYQRHLFYVRPTAGTNAPDKLTPQEPSPSCYTIAGPSQNSNWGVYFFLGGPGGSGC